MRAWRRNAALVTAAALITVGCGAPTTAPPKTPAPPAQAPAGLVPVTVQVAPALAAGAVRRRPAGARAARVDDECSGRGSRRPGWRRGRRTARCWCRCRPTARCVKLTPTARPGARSVLLDDLDAPHGLAFAGIDAVRRGKRPGRRLHATPMGRDRPAGRRHGLPDDRSARPRRRLRARAEERRGRIRRRGVLLDRVHRQHLRRRPLRDARAGDDHAHPAAGGPYRGVRARGAQRHRAWRSPRTVRCGRR